MIHKYKLNGYNICLDVHSGAVHVLDDITYDVLEFCSENMTEDPPEEMYAALSDKYDRNDLTEAYEALYELYDMGQLFSPDDYEQFADLMTKAPIKSMCINISHDCNLRCEYCFAAKGDFGQGRCLMSLNTAKKAIDFIIANSGTRHNLEVDFFGGEPLMNFDVVKQTVEYARSIEKQHNKNFRFTITTNGLLLDDEKIDFINREMHNCVLSLDGRKEVNDKLRVTPNGKGCYDIIVPKYQKLVSQRGDKDYYIRGTFTTFSKDFTADVLHMKELGFEQLSIEPVVSDPKLDYSIKENDLPMVFNEYERLAKTLIDMRKRGEYFNFFHFMIDLDQGPCAIKRLRGCGCGNEYVAVTPQGDIYPCHQFVGEEQYRLGDVWRGVTNTALREKFRACNAYARPECAECWAKFYCSGGCAANAYHASGSITGIYEPGCELFRKRIECAIMMKAAEAEDPELRKYAKTRPAQYMGCGNADEEDCEFCGEC